MPQKRRTTNLEHVAGLVFGRPWAIHPADMDVIAGVVNLYLSGEKPTGQEAQQAADTRLYGAERTGEATQAKTVRVLPLHGTINSRADSFDLMSGGTSPQQFARSVRAAADDPSVTEIILDVDSGGGTVAGTQQMYQAVQYATSKKPVTAVCNGATCSAAYWAVSPSTSIVATGTAEVGSIGILAGWRDTSAAMQDAGIKPYYYRSGEQKALGGPGEPMTEGLDATLRDTVDEMFQVFLDDIAAGRQITPAQAREKWGSGRTWIGQAAVKVGLADRMGTLRGEIDRAVSGHAPSPMKLAALAPPGDHLVASTTVPTVNAQTPDQVLGVQVEAPSPDKETPPVKIRLQAADGTVHEFDPSDLTGIQAFLNQQYQAKATSTILAAYSALGIAVEAGTTPTSLDMAALARLKAQASDGETYRASLIDRIGALVITNQGNDEAGQQASERQKRVWAQADIADLQAEVQRLEAVRDGQFPNAQISNAGSDKKPTPTRAFYARR